MDNAEVEWSLPGQPDTISIGNDGVITLTPQYPLTDDNGVDVVVRATVKGTNVTDEKQSIFITQQEQQHGILSVRQLLKTERRQHILLQM